MKFKHKISAKENAANKEAEAYERRKALSMGDNEATVRGEDKLSV